jgi:hypothetical protein
MVLSKTNKTILILVVVTLVAGIIMLSTDKFKRTYQVGDFGVPLLKSKTVFDFS